MSELLCSECRRPPEPDERRLVVAGHQCQRPSRGHGRPAPCGGYYVRRDTLDAMDANAPQRLRCTNCDREAPSREPPYRPGQRCPACASGGFFIGQADALGTFYYHDGREWHQQMARLAPDGMVYTISFGLNQKVDFVREMGLGVPECMPTQRGSRCFNPREEDRERAGDIWLACCSKGGRG